MTLTWSKLAYYWGCPVFRLIERPFDQVMIGTLIQPIKKKAKNFDWVVDPTNQSGRFESFDERDSLAECRSAANEKPKKEMKPNSYFIKRFFMNFFL